MKGLFNTIKNDKSISFAFIASLIFILLSTVYILISYVNLPPFIPIFNQLPWGDQRLGTTIFIFIPIAAALSILGINIIIASIIYKKIPLISRMLAATSFLVSILAGILVIRTIKLFL